MNEHAPRFEGASFRLPTRPDVGTLHVTLYPDRKNVSLCLQKGGYVYPLAYFKSDQAAQDFLNWMSALAEVADG